MPDDLKDVKPGDKLWLKGLVGFYPVNCVRRTSTMIIVKTHPNSRVERKFWAVSGLEIGSTNHTKLGLPLEKIYKSLPPIENPTEGKENDKS